MKLGPQVVVQCPSCSHEMRRRLTISTRIAAVTEDTTTGAYTVAYQAVGQPFSMCTRCRHVAPTDAFLEIRRSRAFRPYDDCFEDSGLDPLGRPGVAEYTAWIKRETGTNAGR